jgi:predicted esterase
MEFPAPHIQPPQAPHTHTVILLHGRASDGEEFAEELFSSTTSNGKSLPACLPSYRWVFPTSCERYSTTFQEDICSWFDAYSLGDISERQELQKEGLTQSVCHILNVIEEEANLLERRFSHIYLGGISQGMATALWTFFAAVGTGRIKGPLGGLLGLCGWLPFAQNIEGLLCEPSFDRPCTPQAQRIVSGFFFDEISAEGLSQTNQTVDSSVLSTPVLLSHGTDDAWVSVDLGRQTSRIIRRVMTHVECHEFTGAESDGHWIKEPEGFDQILRFLEK